MTSSDIPRPKLAFLCTGQGAQYPHMGRSLYDSEPTFRRVLDECASLLADALPMPLLSVIFPTSDAPPLLDKTEYAQPALFALEYALAELWHSRGIVPDALLGHSLGEYTAACLAGVMSLETGLRLVTERGHLMGTLPEEGEMAAVFASVEEIEPVLAAFADELSIAAINGPTHVVISGRREAVEAALDSLEEAFIMGRSLNISVAAHSPLTLPILEPFEAFARDLSFQPPKRLLVSALLGRALRNDEVPDASFWRRHIREPVLFAAGVQALHEAGCNLFLELGPSDTLIKMAQKCIPKGVGTWLPSLDKEDLDGHRFQESAQHLAEQGLP